MPLSIEIQHIRSIVSGLDIGGEMPQEASEYSEKSLVINLPKKIPEGMLVSLQLNLKLHGADGVCEVTAKVVSCEDSSDDGVFRVQFHLNQYNQSAWVDFLRAADADQYRVEKLFRAMKGDLE